MDKGRKTMAQIDKTITKRIKPPARTIESREQQIIYAAVDLAEKQILEGTASSQVLTHYLKLASTNNLLEKEMLTHQIALLRAKTESLESNKNVEELYRNAVAAMKEYSGNGDEND